MAGIALRLMHVEARARQLGPRRSQSWDRLDWTVLNDVEYDELIALAGQTGRDERGYTTFDELDGSAFDRLSELVYRVRWQEFDDERKD